MSAAEHLPAISRAFGPQWPDITEVPTWIVLKVQAYHTDKARLIDWTNHYLNKAPAS